VPVVRGAFTERLSASDTLRDSTLRATLPLLGYLADDPFWQAQISEIHIGANHDLVLVPTLGSMTILFGEAQGHAPKLARLHRFFTLVLPRTGWGYYKTLNIKFDGQLIATRA
jgi:cell division protein FtsQ